MKRLEQFLTEIRKPVGEGLFPTLLLVGPGNIDKFRRVVNKGSVIFTDGKKRKIQNKNAVIKSIDNAASLAFKAKGKGNPRGAKEILNRMVIKSGGKEYRIYDIRVQDIKLPLKATSNNLRASNQGLQCIASACATYGIVPTLENAKEIEKYVALGSSNVEEVLRVTSWDWIKSAIMTHRKLTTMFGNKFTSHKFYEESSRVGSAIKAHGNKLYGSGTDRWSPADIFIIHDKFNIRQLEKIKDLEELNQKMVEWFDKKILMGVSLKKATPVLVDPKDRKGPKTREADAKIKNHPEKSDDVIQMNPKVAPSIKKAFGVDDGWQYSFEDDTEKGFKTASYGGKASAGSQVRASDIRLKIYGKSGGRAGGATMGKNVREVMAKYKLNMPSKADMISEFEAGYEAPLTSKKNQDFFKKYYQMYSKHRRGVFSDWKSFREGCYESAPFNHSSKKYGGSGGNPTACTWINLHFVDLIQSLPKSKRIECLNDLYMKAASIEADKSSAHVVFGTKL